MMNMLPGKHDLIPGALLELAAIEEQSWPDRLNALADSGAPVNIGTTVLGTRGTGNINQATRRIDMASEVLMLEPNVTPLTVLAGRLDSSPTGNPEFSWTEDEYKPRFDAVDTTTGTGTSVRVLAGTKFSVGDTVRVTRTGELILVTAVDTVNNVLTVQRGIGAAAVAVADRDELLIVGSAQPEGDTSRTSRSINVVKVTNYTQIFRTPFKATETLRHSNSNLNPNDWDRQAAKAGAEFNKDQEYTYWHGKAYENLSGGANGLPLRLTAGALSFIATNVTDVGGTMTESELWAALTPIFRFGSQGKVAFCSALAIDVINAYPRGKLEVIQSDNDTTYGLNVRTLVSPHGTLRLVTNYLFEGAKYGGYMAVLDMAAIKRRYLANDQGSRDTHIRTNIQASDEDSRKDEYLAECGLQFGQERWHGLITNITG